MRRWFGVAVVVIGLVGCGSSGGSDTSVPTTTSTEATTTTDPEPVIRQYASAVAAAQPALEKQGNCTPIVDCALEGTAAYTDMLTAFDALEPPKEILSLVFGVTETKGAVREAVKNLSTCMEGAGDDYNQTCTTEGIQLQYELADVPLAGWGPYL